jgi:hypothetical protein
MVFSSVAKPNSLAPLHNSFPFSSDHGLRPCTYSLKALLAFANMEEPILAYHGRDERNAEMDKFGTTHPSQI